MWHNLPCPAIQVVPKDDVTFSEVWRDKVLFPSFRISSQQASILVIPSPALGCSLLFRINVPPETLMTGFSESQAPQTTSKPSWNSPQTPQTCHLQLASKFQKDRWTWAHDHGSSSIQRHFQHRTNKFSRLAWYAVSESERRSAERPQTRGRGSRDYRISVFAAATRPSPAHIPIPNTCKNSQFHTSESMKTTRPNSWILKHLNIWMGIT